MRIFAWFLVIIAFSSAIMVIVYTLTLGSTTVAKNLGKGTKDTDIVFSNLTDSYFDILELKYYDRVAVLNAVNATSITDRCNMDDKKEVLIIEIITSDKRIPDHCEVFSDNRFLDEFDIIPYPCHPYCDEKEFVFTVTAKELDIFEDHEIRICCDEICRSKYIERICKKL